VDLATEQAHLAQANEHISAGKVRIAAQEELVDRLRRDGHPAQLAQDLLDRFRETLVTWNDHRDEICRQIDRLSG